MKRIAIVSLGYLWFPCEPGPSRFFQIANTFVKAGWEVTCVTTSFQHFRKQPRNREEILEQGYPFRIEFIDTPAYEKNVSFARARSNREAEKNLRQYLELHLDEFDAVYVSIPANNIAAMVTDLCRARNIPAVVDVEDLWPEAMVMVVKNGFLRNLFFGSFRRDADRAYQNASGIIGTSEDYTDRAFQVRPRDIPAETVYVGCDLAAFDAGVEAHRAEIKKPEGEFWVTYAGSISTSYDIGNLIEAGRLLTADGVHVQILGTGLQAEELQEASRELPNIHFWGYVAYPKMAAVLAASDVLVNSFVQGAPQSIVNKVGDYLAAGRPMINTLENPVFCRLIEENAVGVNVAPGQPEKLAGALQLLRADSDVRARMGQKARALAEERFDRATGYQKIVSLTEGVMKHGREVRV